MHPSNPGAEGSGAGATAPLLVGNGADPSLRVTPSRTSASYQRAAFPRGFSACSLAGGASEEQGLEYKKTQRKLIIALVIAFLFMIVEVVGGVFAHSLAIITDAAHLLSDVSGFAVSVFAAVYAARQSKDHFSYGYHRVEVLGALGSIMIIWLVTGILLFEAIMRIIHPEKVDGKLMFIIAIAGIGVNLLMIAVLGGHHHGHSHGPVPVAAPPATQRAVAVPSSALEEEASLAAELSLRRSPDDEHVRDVEAGTEEHDHSHHEHAHHDHDAEHHGHSHPQQRREQQQSRLVGQTSGAHLLGEGHIMSDAKAGHDHGSHDHSGHDHSSDGHSHGGHSHGGHSHGGHGHSHGNMNVRGAVLHVIGDLVQSIGVAIAGALIWAHQDNPSWYIADPICTFMFALIVLWTTRAILRDISDVLMERVPRGLCINTIHDDLSRLPGVEELHDLHVWSLTPGIPLLCMHANISSEADPTEVLHAITSYCRNLGIQHTTVQLVDGGSYPCAVEH